MPDCATRSADTNRTGHSQHTDPAKAAEIAAGAELGRTSAFCCRNAGLHRDSVWLRNASHGVTGQYEKCGLAFFGYNYILFFFLTWFPSYLTMAQHLSIKDMSIATVLPWVLGFCGLAAGGAVSDAVFRATGRALFARKLVLTVCLSVSAVCVALAGLVTTVGSALMLMSGAVFFLYLTGSTYWAILQDTVRGENIGGVGGFIHMIANCAGIIGPTVTGFIVQSTGAFTSAFVLAGGIAIMGVVCVLVFVRPITPTAVSGMRSPVAPAH